MASKLIAQTRGATFIDSDTDIRDYEHHTGVTDCMGCDLFILDGSWVKTNGNIEIPLNLNIGGQIVTSLPAGDNQVIGYGEDVQTQSGLYLVYNSNGNHCIFQYTPSTNDIVAVAYAQPIFNFQLSNKIRNVSIQDGIAFWTDGFDQTDATHFQDTDFNTERSLIIADAISYTRDARQFADNNFDAGNVLLVGFTSTAGFLAGQRIRVQQYPGFTNASYNVECTIVSVTVTTILTDIPFGLNSPPNPGLIILLPTTGYDHIDLQTIDGIRFPPDEPTAIYGTDNSYAKNFFNNTEKLCQFQYQWQYVDKSLSVFSPMSMLAAPYGDETVDNTNNIALSQINNVIYVTVQTGSSLITDITIGVRFGNTGEFGTFITLNKKNLGIANDTTYTYNFYNDRQITIIDQDDWVRLQDDVPQVTNKGFLVKTDNNTHKLSGQCTEGWDNINPNIFLSILQTDHTNILANITQPTRITDGLGDLFIVLINMTIVPGMVFIWKSPQNGDDLSTGTVSFSYVFQQGDTNLSFSNLFLAWLNANTQNYAWIKFTNQIDIQGFVQDDLNNTTINQFSIGIYSNIAKFSTFKSGAKHLLGIEYGRDEGWTGTVQTMNQPTPVPGFPLSVQGTEINVPFITQAPNTISASELQNQIAFQIYHIPPIWATKYRIVYAGNNTVSSFLQITVGNIDVSDNSVSFMILGSLTDYSSVNPQSILAYNYTPGDRIRLISFVNGATGLGAFFPNYIDVEVVSYDPSTSKLSCQSLSGVTFPPNNIHNSILVEIYTPYKQTGNPIYYELSPTLPIINPHKANRTHGSNHDSNLNQWQDPNTNTPAIYLLQSGDTWLKLRQVYDNNGDGFTALIEDYNFSDFYLSASYSKGRPNGINPYAKRQSLEIVRRSETYISGTQINGLNSYWSIDSQGGDYWANLMPQDGYITGLSLMGNQLHVYQGQKITSILLERVQMTNTDGSSVPVSSTTKFFGSHQRREDTMGTLYPESYCGGEKHEYCFDVLKGRFVRVATDRNWNISMLYKINTFTVQLAQAMRSAGTENFNVFGYYDSGYDKVYWTIIDNRPATVTVIILDEPVIIPNPAFVNNPYIPPITIVFCENGDKESKGWQGFMPYHPEFWGNVGTQMITFKSGQLFIHTPNAPKNYFYNGLSSDNAPCSVTVIMNKNPEIVKTFYDISEYCNNIMAAPNTGDISILPTANYPQGMSSRLIPNKFTAVEGVYNANFLKDVNTPNIDPVTSILEGRDLKGEAISVKLSNPDNNPLVLNKIIITGFVSDPTPG